MKQKCDELTPDQEQRVRECVMEWRKQVLEAFKKMNDDIEAKPAPCDGTNYEVKSAVIWKLRQEPDIKDFIPLAAICNAFHISVTYYNQLKSIHLYEWEDIFREYGKHNQSGNKNIGITT